MHHDRSALATAPPRVRRLLAAALVVVGIAALPLAGGAVHDPVAAAPGSGATRTSRMALAVRSQSYDVSTHRWTIQLEATLTSNAVCVPGVFDCIVAPLAPPSGVQLTDVSCLSPYWNHLVVFRNHCLKQVGFAGFGQRFRFTYVTDPSVDGTEIDLSGEFGRGVLPVVFQRLATASVRVDLTSRPTLSEDCPEEVDAGSALTCTVEVTNPAAVTVSGLDLTDQPGGLLAGGTLTQTSGPPTFSCAALACTGGSLAPGEHAELAYATTAPGSPTGGDADNVASLTWTGGSDPLSATEPITVKGTGDTDLVVTKTTSQTTVAPGGAVSWTVTVSNTGTLPATDVDLADTVPVGLADASISFVSGSYVSGTGSWTCTGVTCTAADMPVGTATFTVSGTVPATAAAGVLVNEVGVHWSNDTYGPDFPVTAAAEITVDPPATTTSTTPTTVPSGEPQPARLSFTG
jgi:uncharacterized repeat protein (TIGR01451 family)